MKKNKDYFRIMGLLFLTFLLVGCSIESMNDALPNNNDATEVSLSIDAQMMVFAQQQTRAGNVPSRGEWDHMQDYLDNMILFCFDEKGGFLAHRVASVTDSQKATFSVIVPGSTRIIHFAGNCATTADFQNLDDLKYLGMNEDTFIPTLKMEYGKTTKIGDSSTKLIPYWSRIKVSTKESLKMIGSSSNPVFLHPDMVVISWNPDEAGFDGTQALISGFQICNRHRYGSLAPFNVNVTNDTDGPFVLPGFSGESENNEVVKLTPPYDEILKDETKVSWTTQATFECGNTYDHQLFLIFKYGDNLQGTNAAAYSGKYVKAMVVDESKNPLPLYRGHFYSIKFTGLPNTAYLYDTYQEAYDGDAANNPWFTIEDSTPEVGETANGKTTSLQIDKGTEQTFIRSGDAEILFTTMNMSDTDLNVANMEVMWLENGSLITNQNLVIEKVKEETSPSGDKYTHFRIKLYLLQPPTQPTRNSGRLMLKVGKFIRRITIWLQEPFTFYGRKDQTEATKLYFMHNPLTPFEPSTRPNMTAGVSNSNNTGLIELWMSYHKTYNPFDVYKADNWTIKLYSNRLNCFKWESGGRMTAMPIVVNQSPTFYIDGKEKKIGYNYHYELSFGPSYGNRPGIYMWMNSVQNDCPDWDNCPYNTINHVHLFITGENAEDVELVFDYKNNKSYLVNEGELPSGQ